VFFPGPGSAGCFDPFFSKTLSSTPLLRRPPRFSSRPPRLSLLSVVLPFPVFGVVWMTFFLSDEQKLFFLPLLCALPLPVRILRDQVSPLTRRASLLRRSTPISLTRMRFPFAVERVPQPLMRSLFSPPLTIFPAVIRPTSMSGGSSFLRWPTRHCISLSPSLVMKNTSPGVPVRIQGHFLFPADGQIHLICSFRQDTPHLFRDFVASRGLTASNRGLPTLGIMPPPRCLPLFPPLLSTDLPHKQANLPSRAFSPQAEPFPGEYFSR